MLHAKNGSQVGKYEYKEVFHFLATRTIMDIIAKPSIKTRPGILSLTRKKEGLRVWHAAHACFEVIFLKNFLHTVVLVFVVASLGIAVVEAFLVCSRVCLLKLELGLKLLLGSWSTGLGRWFGVFICRQEFSN